LRIALVKVDFGSSVTLCMAHLSWFPSLRMARNLFLFWNWS
jgi:hypothetical protein